jgi:hypothetical protein
LGEVVDRVPQPTAARPRPHVALQPQLRGDAVRLAGPPPGAVGQPSAGRSAGGMDLATGYRHPAHRLGQ